jgi:hypothetical protein
MPTMAACGLAWERTFTHVRAVEATHVLDARAADGTMGRTTGDGVPGLTTDD